MDAVLDIFERLLEEVLASIESGGGFEEYFRGQLDLLTDLMERLHSNMEQTGMNRKFSFQFNRLENLIAKAKE